MNKFLEVEVKYDATGISMSKFKHFIDLYTSKSVSPKYLRGVDTYYNSGVKAIRHRHTDENQEITIKKRHSKNSTTIRTEVNVGLCEIPQELEVKTLLNMIGYKERVKLQKEYLVYKCDYMDGYVEFVWYKVRSKGKPTRTFIEIEVHGIKDDIVILEEFKEAVQQGLGMSESRILNKSLYEIYK